MRKQSALISKIAAKEAATRATATTVATMVVPAERLLDMASAIVIEIIAAIVPTGPEKPAQTHPPSEAKAPTTTVSGLTKVVSRPLRRGRSIAFLREANALFFRSRRICVPCPFHPQQPT